MVQKRILILKTDTFTIESCEEKLIGLLEKNHPQVDDQTNDNLKAEKFHYDDGDRPCGKIQ